MKSSLFRKYLQFLQCYQFVAPSHHRRRLPCERRTMRLRMHWWYYDKTSALIASGDAFVWSNFVKHTLPVALQLFVSHRLGKYFQHVLFTFQNNTCTCWSFQRRPWLRYSPMHIFRIAVRVANNLHAAVVLFVFVILFKRNSLVRNHF